MLRPTRRFVLIGLGSLLVLAAAGALYQDVSVQREARRFPPPGRLVDVGGHRLHLVCLGEGEPTVVFESSAFGSSLSAEAARMEVSAETRVCSYDRMGTGWSDPSSGRISVGMLADDLKVLLDRAGLAAPYVLVPASIGGLTVEMFARRYPDRVAGLVFVDAANSASQILHRASGLNWMHIEAACLGRLAARLGLLRLFDPFDLRQDPSDAAARSAALLYRTERMATLCDFVRGVPTSLQELKDAPPLAPDVPLVVLIAETSEGRLPPGFGSLGEASAADSRESQKRFAQRSTRGTWRIVPNSGHLIAASQPHAVASAVLEMLALFRRAERR